MPATPIKELVFAAIQTSLKAMDGKGYAVMAEADAYTYAFDRVERVKENEIAVGDDCLAVIAVGEVEYVTVALQANQKIILRQAPVIVAFVFPATPADPADPLSIDRTVEAELMFADLNKCLAPMEQMEINNSPVEVEFARDVLDLTTIESPKVYGELHMAVTFRHRYGDATIN